MPGSRWRSQQMWEPMGDYEASEHMAGLRRSGSSFAEYARANGVSRNALSQAVKRLDPAFHAEMLLAHPEVTGRKTGASFESSVRGVLGRRGYYVIKSWASKSAIDMLAVGADRPNLMVQAKRGGALPFGEWNALFDLATQYGCWPVLAMKPPEDGKGAIFFRLTARKDQKGMRSAGLLAPFDPRSPYALSVFAPPEVAD